MKIEVLPNDNVKEHEDKHGRVRASRRRTWVLLVDGDVQGEYKTKREATRAGESRSNPPEGDKR